jgi:opacity protein-like surface antigen
MKKILLLCGMLVALSATVASAAGVNLAWNNCLNGGGAHNKTFACTSNSGTNTLVASVYAPAGIDMWTAFEAEYYFGFGGVQPAWWQLRNQTGQLNQCRNNAISANAGAAGLTGCEDVYAGQGAGGIGTYQNAPGGDATRARLLLVFAIPAGTEVPLTPETEYFVANVAVSNVKSAGLGACAGCQQGACINLTNVKVVQPAGAPGGDVNVNIPAQSNTASWQASGDAACAGLPTPATRATWGSVKALYR